MAINKSIGIDKDDHMILRELLRKTEEKKPIEDAYSAAHIDDPEDDDFMSAAEQGFMLGYIS